MFQVPVNPTSAAADAVGASSAAKMPRTLPTSFHSAAKPAVPGRPASVAPSESGAAASRAMDDSVAAKQIAAPATLSSDQQMAIDLVVRLMNNIFQYPSALQYYAIIPFYQKATDLQRAPE